MDYFLSKIRSGIFDLFSSGYKSFNSLSEPDKFDLIKDFMLMKEYSYLEVMENLVLPKFDNELFKHINKISLDLPNDSDSEIDLMFINFICSPKNDVKVYIRFTDFFIESIEDFMNKIFDFYLDAKNEDYYFGYGYKEINQ